ncbi:hypothetical protein CR194_16170 [Salipaludibacillus keqinensis]|uniref:4Fe-4S ferredoxin-type domain-containing protein n=1 Tax=Salipaludibacillus keqinensis TaxID=2045207 RepID=A0A323TCH8_9BACI|nr:4Fe-4S binding protein [Salipaludibacillus keqinensis]PYZ92366.1 hypothetical protein CR194_16170 [Salipaludibacillus keqinensis]
MWQRLFYRRVKERSSIRFNEKSCLRERYKNSTCDKCVAVCPNEAFSIVDNKIKLEEDRCHNCHLCVHSCPTEALYYESEMISKYETRIAQKESVTFTCQRQASSEGNDVALPCLQALTPEYFMISELYDKTSEVFCDGDICKTCEMKWDPLEGLVWLKDWNEQLKGERRITVSSDENMKIGKKRTYNRRELFKMTSEETKSQIGDFVLGSYEEIASFKDKINHTQKRKYLLGFLRANEQYLNQGDLGVLPQKLQATKIEVDNKCTICQKCSSICPTGALKVVEGEEAASLQFYTDQCIDCDICEAACKHVYKKPVRRLSDLLESHVLQIINQDTCPKCGFKKNVNHPSCEDCEVKEEKKRSLLSDW